MPVSNQISRETIELEIYKTFELLKEKKDVTIADFLETLNLEELLPWQYRSIKFSFHSLLRAILFKKMKGLRFQTQLEQYLRTHKSEREKLGLQIIPDQRTISNFLNNVLDSETKEIIDFISSSALSISDKFGIIFDEKNIKLKEIKKDLPRRSFYRNKNEKTREISSLFKKRFGSFLDLNIKKNARYSKNDLLDLILHLCNTGDFAENGSKTFQLQRMKVPNGDTLLYHLKDYQDTDQIKRMFISMFEMIWETARKANQFQRIVDCSIDYTSQHFYGDKGTPMVTEMKPDRGTSYGYKFATITISEHNQRFTLLAVPVGPFDTKEEILRTLLDYALQRVKIRRLYVDRGFFDSSCIELFRHYHLKFLMPCTANERIKRILEVVPSPTVIKDYEMKNTTFNVVVVSDEFNVKRAFATNIEFNENDVGLAERLFNLYSKRWTIETSYRVKKHSFRPKTTSKNYFIRLFYFLFSALMYNLWLLADILICLAMLGFYDGKHIITSKYFGNILVLADPGG